MTTKELKKHIASCAGGAIAGLLLAWGIFRWEFKEFLFKSVVLLPPPSYYANYVVSWA